MRICSHCCLRAASTRRSVSSSASAPALGHLLGWQGWEMGQGRNCGSAFRLCRGWWSLLDFVRDRLPIQSMGCARAALNSILIGGPGCSSMLCDHSQGEAFFRRALRSVGNEEPERFRMARWRLIASLVYSSASEATKLQRADHRLADTSNRGCNGCSANVEAISRSTKTN